MKKNKKQNGYSWILIITVVTFFTSMILSLITSNLTEKLSIYAAVFVLIGMIGMGILFDIIGVAVTAANETPFHSLAAKKEKGAKKAIFLLRNAEKVSNICNDVIGDIAGIISGATATVIVISIVKTFELKEDIIPTIFMTAAVAAFTVGGKAFGKGFAINKAYKIILFVAKILNILSFGNGRK